MPKLTHKNDQAALQCLKLTDSSRHVSFSILKIPVEYCHTIYAKRINHTSSLVLLKSSDIVMVRKLIKSIKKIEKVLKLCYAVRSHYQMFYNTGHKCHFIKKLHIPDSTELKYMDYDSYHLPSFLKPCEYVDTTDTR